MPVIESQVDTTSAEFRDNRAHMDALEAELKSHLAAARVGGGDEAQRRQRDQGKLPVRERVERLLDPATPFLEIGALAADGMYDGDAPSAGIVTGIGRVGGREVMVVANDPTVKGGTYFPITVKKHLRAQEIAGENRLPCVYLVDSGGAFLPLQAEVFPDREHFGRIFYNEARLSAAGIAQISVVLGSCTAGGAYVPAMSDEAVIVKGRGTGRTSTRGSAAWPTISPPTTSTRSTSPATSSPGSPRARRCRGRWATATSPRTTRGRSAGSFPKTPARPTTCAR
jgi:acetyl-CoA carboxylase carboxyltransferase component